MKQQIKNRTRLNETPDFYKVQNQIQEKSVSRRIRSVTHYEPVAEKQTNFEPQNLRFDTSSEQSHESRKNFQSDIGSSIIQFKVDQS